MSDPEATRTSLRHALLALLAEMEANHAKHLLYDRANPADIHTKTLARFYEQQRLHAAMRCDELQASLDALPPRH